MPARRRAVDQSRRPAAEQEAVNNWVADEKTARRTAEAMNGGLSSEESAARYARGENPGGTHARTNRHASANEGGASPVHQRPEHEEPQDRVERAPGGERHMSSVRRGQG